MMFLYIRIAPVSIDYFSVGTAIRRVGYRTSGVFCVTPYVEGVTKSLKDAKRKYQHIVS